MSSGEQRVWFWEMGLEPHDAFSDVVPYFHRERDDQQAARELAEERAQRATEIIRKLYWYAYSCGQQTLDVSEQDFRFLCSELGLDWRDITGR